MSDLSKQIKKWVEMLDKIYSSLISYSRKSKAYDTNDMAQFVAYTIKHSQFFTFDSVRTLIKNGQYFDSFSLLRALFEGHITLWRICNTELDITMQFLERAMKIRYNYLVELNKMFKDSYNDYYDENALIPIEIEKGYWEKPLNEVVDEIDAIEENAWPYHALMFIRLYSTGAEFIHRSSYAIDQAFMVTRSNRGKNIIVGNPNLAIESAWWSSIIILDSEKWYRRFLKDKYHQEFVDLKKESMKLASQWTKYK